MHLTTVTCHECSMQTDIYSFEWPPVVFFCPECSSIFTLTGITKENEPTYHLSGYCRFTQ